MQVNINDTDEHQQGSEKRINEKLEGRLYSFFSSPSAAQEIDGYQCQFPEKIKQQGIHRGEHSHEACLCKQHQSIEGRRIFIIILISGNEDQWKCNCSK